MKTYVSEMLKSHTKTIIGFLGIIGKSGLLLCIVQYWRACVVNEENQALPMVICCSQVMYKYYSHLGFPK